MTKRDAHLGRRGGRNLRPGRPPEYEPHRVRDESAGCSQAAPYESWNSEKLKWAVHADGVVDGEPGGKEWTSEIALLQDIVTPTRIPPEPGDGRGASLYAVSEYRSMPS
jgi:hypothetical protein